MKIPVGENSIELTDDQLEAFSVLTKLQRAVALKSLEGLCDAEAYRQGGGKAKNANSLSTSASEILNNPNVRQFIDYFNGNLIASSIMTRVEMLERLTGMARTNITDVVKIHNKVMTEGPDGEEIEQSFWALKDTEEMTDGGVSSISELTASKDGLKIKLHDQKVAMKQIAEIEGFNATARLDHTSKDGSMSPNPTLTQEQAMELLKKNGMVS